MSNLMDSQWYFVGKASNNAKSTKDGIQKDHPIVKNKRLRSCKLKNIYSGKTIEANSICSFCKEAKLYKNAIYHISPVLNGQRLHYKNWYRADVLDRIIELKDIYGNLYQKMTIQKILRRKILTPNQVNSLINNKKKVAGKIALASTVLNDIISPRNWKITKFEFIKDHKIIEGSTITEISDKLGCSASNLYPLIYGFKNKIGNIELFRLKIERKKY